MVAGARREAAAMAAMALAIGTASVSGCGDESVTGTGGGSGGTSGVACIFAADCTASLGACMVAKCSQGRCGAVPAQAGTFVARDAPPDCLDTVCDGAGNLTKAPDPANAPAPANACATVTCSAAGAVVQGSAPAGTACSFNGGAACDGAGACVACVDNGTCTSPDVCSPAHTCVPPTCTDGMKDGAETGVDCGGGACPPCGTGGGCLSVRDCVSLVCSGMTCAAPTCSDGVRNGQEAGVDCGGPCPPCLFDVLTQHNDVARTGQQSAEVILTTANVSAAAFGLAFTIPVDDDVYAQPLYANSVTVAGAVHDVLYVATMNDTLYAFDADDGALLWQTSFLGPDAFVLVGPDDLSLDSSQPCMDVIGHMGVLSTPAIDRAAGPHGTLYVVAKTKDGTGTQHFTLHALDLGSGAEQPGSPVDLGSLAIQVIGTGIGNDGQGNVPFDVSIQFSRPALLVAGGQVVLGFESLCSQGPYHGWLLAFDELTLALRGVFNATPDGAFGGIWQGGDGPAADATGNIYFAIGNGDFSADTAGGRDYGDSIVKLSPSLAVLDYFTPSDQATLFGMDWDLGSAGVTRLPGTTLLAQVGKTDTLRVVDADSMGHYDPAGDTQIVQELELGNGADVPPDNHENFSGPVSWALPGGPMVYVQAENDALHQLQLAGGQLQPVATGASTAIWPGAGLSVSSNGAAPGTGIVWSLSRTGVLVSSARNLYDGVLQAYDAAAVSHLLWTSAADTADDPGSYMWFTKPTVANGKVYVPTSANHIAVYANR